ncbi:MAG: hypothetical protein H8E82_04855 [Candidatus Marinimicrobia bacterium]|nr:hypothetical protein [Candidatus Neomarinimicrobiota bacterium]
MRIRIKWASNELSATLKDSPTSQKLMEVLPCSSKANLWGKEVYFSIPVSAELEPDARQVVPPGTVCFWVEGSSLAIPYGPTPVSVGDECRLVTEVNILGQVDGDPRLLESVKSGENITVELIFE